MNAKYYLLALAALLGTSSTLRAQEITLIDWPHSWNYMHPTAGALPAGSGATEPNSGATKWYAPEATFATSYTGPSFSTSGTGYEAGLAPGPIGYGAMDYTTTPLPAPAEFAGLATTLTTPGNTARYTAYFRTTFTVPNDGSFYINPVIRYILDDGGFIYLDGELVLRVNHSSATADTYLALASNTTNTESHIRDANLNLTVGSVTGGNTAVTPTIAGNATVVKRITSLAPGVHTIAVSAHNQAVGSSDLDFAVQVKSTKSDIAIFASASGVTRSTNGTPAVETDDLISFNVNVTPTGLVSASGWTVTGPLGSAALGLSGAYGTDVSIPNIPISEFAAGPLNLTVSDVGTPAASSTVQVFPQRIIASDDHLGTNLPIFTTGTIPGSGWVLNDATRNVTMVNGGGGARKVYTSEVVDLTSVGAVQFTGVLQVDDTSTGFEAGDSFLAYLIVDGNTAAPINLITAHDTITVNGVLEDDELAAAAGTFNRDLLSYVLPPSANSVQIVIEGINDSGSESFIVRDLKLSNAPPTLQAFAGAAAVNNQNTVNPADDTFGAPVTIEAYNIGASPGWTSNSVPATGLYADPQPVVFQNYLITDGPKTITLTDVGNVTATKQVTISPPTPTLTLSPATGFVRNANGPGLADDTVSFNVTITGTNGGPQWTATGAINTTGSFGATTLTVPAPAGIGSAAITFTDSSYAVANQPLTVTFPSIYVIGHMDLGGGSTDILASNVLPINSSWVNAPAARTLTMNNGTTSGAGEKTISSDIINLASVTGPIGFSAKLRSTDTTSGFEPGDTFTIYLVYDGNVGSPIPLISSYDLDVSGRINGAELTPATAGPPPVTGAGTFNFTFSTLIPDSANSVQIFITGLNDSANETMVVSDVALTLDADQDGIPDSYEIANGMNKDSAADRDTDLDGDGQNNYQEYIAGTSANTSSSVLRITNVTKVGQTASVSWSSVAGKNYRVFISPDLTTWTDFGTTFPAVGSPGTETTAGPLDLTPLGNPDKYFLRVVVQ